VKGKLIEISSDGILKLESLSQSIDDQFWKNRMQEYPGLVKKSLTLFVTSYLRELSFSSMTAVKTKTRNLLELENDIIMCVSSTD
jgi:hypothetical protein